LLFAFAVLAVWFLEPVLLRRLVGEDLTPPLSPATFLIHGYAFQLCGLAIFLLFRFHPAGRPPSSDVYTVVALGRGLLGVLYCMPLMAGAKMIWEFALNTFGLPHDLQDVVMNFREVSATGGAPAWIFMLVVVAPISEECIFRGALFRFLVSRLPLSWATTISSILFALLHQNLYSFVPLAVLGAALSLIYAKTGRLIAPIILHMVFNLISVVFILLLRGT
jgi:hypothetical protein